MPVSSTKNSVDPGILSTNKNKTPTKKDLFSQKVSDDTPQNNSQNDEMGEKHSARGPLHEEKQNGASQPLPAGSKQSKNDVNMDPSTAPPIALQTNSKPHSSTGGQKTEAGDSVVDKNGNDESHKVDAKPHATVNKSLQDQTSRDATLKAKEPTDQVSASSSSNTHTSLLAASKPAVSDADEEVSNSSSIRPVIIDDERKRVHLLDTYSPYLVSSDKSLSDARQRLIYAIEQTRQLRAAFTNRVYEKYRIVLQPVPKSNDQIVGKILSNPKESKRKIEERIALVKLEKEYEKRDSQGRTAVANSLKKDSLHAASSHSEVLAESEQLFGAGLSLVILPEEDVDENEVDLNDFEHRGPTNPETGQRLGGISSAAANAAEALLDRTRRARSRRIERRRKNTELGIMDESILASIDTNDLPLNTLYGSSGRPSPMVFKSNSVPKSTATPSRSSMKSNKSLQRASSFKRQNSSSSHRSGRGSKSRALHNTCNLLAIHPNAEGTAKAAANALHSMYPKHFFSGGRGSHSSGRSKQNPHPYPGSKGAVTASKSKRSASAAAAANAAIQKNLVLPPPIASTFSNKNTTSLQKPLPSMKLTKDYAVDAVGNVLNHFFDVHCSSVDEKCTQSSVNNVDKSKEGKKGVITKKRKRGMTEIRLFKELKFQDTPVSKLSKCSDGSKSSHVSSPKENKIDPILAFSVLSAVGLIGTKKQQNTSPKVVPVKQTDSSDKKTDSVSSLKSPQKAIRDENILSGTTASFSQSTFDSWIKMPGTSFKPRQAKREVEKSKTVETVGVKIPLLKRKKVSEKVKTPTVICVDDETDSCSTPAVSKPCEKANLEGKKQVQIPSNSNKAVGSKTSPVKIQPKPVADSSKSNEIDADKPKNSSDQKTSRSNDQLLNPVNPTIPDNKTHLAQAGWDPSRAQIASQHYGQAPFLSNIQSNNMRNTYSTLSQTSPTYPQSVTAQSHINLAASMHLHPHLVNNPNVPTSTPNTINAQEFFNRTTGQRSNYTAADWQALRLFSQPGSQLVTNLSLSQTHPQIMLQHSLSEHHRQATAVAGARPNMNSVASMPAHHNNLLFNNGTGVAGAQNFQHARQQPSVQMSPIQAVTAVDPMLLMQLNNRPGSAEVVTTSDDAKSSSSSSAVRPSSTAAGTTNTQVLPVIPKPVPTNSEKKVQQSKTSKSSSTDSKKSQENRPIVPKVPPKENATDASGKRPVEAVKGGDETPSNEKKRRKTQGTEQPEKPSKVPCTTNQSVETSVEPKPLKPSSVSQSKDDGLQFVAPPTPSGLGKKAAELILQGRIHEIDEAEDKTAALSFLSEVSANIPINKTLVFNPLKERLATCGKPSLPKDIITAAIASWLWAEHGDSFQRAFAKNGRIDVDSECKWLITASVNSSVRALVLDDIDMKKSSDGSFRVACTVSKNLMNEINVDDNVDVNALSYPQLLALLDERRMNALRLQCEERALLTNLVCRYVRIVEPFANAYVSSMVRAGIALGHDEVCEIAQDNSTSASSLLPYDIFGDMSEGTGQWEDPCRPVNGYTAGLNAEELTRRAHSRALIQKSLYKLQDKFDIRGGTPNIGPYSERSNTSSGLPPIGSPHGRSSNSRRKSTFDKLFSIGSKPIHVSLPLEWDNRDMENMPYGIFSTSSKGRRRSSQPQSATKRHRVSGTHGSSSKIRRSTEAVDWSEVSQLFQVVASASSQKKETPVVQKAPTTAPAPAVIFAPFCREVQTSLLESGNGWSDDEDGSNVSDEEEDISDEAILKRHQEVLDSMKEKIDSSFEKTQNNRKKK
eukprot:CAMPEP_0178941062 /NCGR_PEP_ID=MMETSP0789-20121207/1177_1 /TAXON_ID=3005 /ORGANISM="Rhizosolenia setigera, Strain CCMP 1694" /LENGTH=1778 /DNA_ID=CAMNT_0020620213 /DNA_START=199 /DNA_END=5535 /DNA_ORIENTATION=+